MKRPNITHQKIALDIMTSVLIGMLWLNAVYGASSAWAINHDGQSALLVGLADVSFLLLGIVALRKARKKLDHPQ